MVPHLDVARDRLDAVRRRVRSAPVALPTLHIHRVYDQNIGGERGSQIMSAFLALPMSTLFAHATKPEDTAPARMVLMRHANSVSHVLCLEAPVCCRDRVGREVAVESVR